MTNKRGTVEERAATSTEVARDDVAFFDDDEVAAMADIEAKRWATLLARLAK